MFDALLQPVGGDWADGVWAILMLGMALLAWWEFRGIRARMKADRERREKDPDPPAT